jgi:Na+-driven multidrug efflux pump/anti-sigma regulatory factor (Ser/Thr protein kinase)
MPKRNPYLVNKTFKSYLFATVLASMALSLGVVINGIIVGNLLGPAALSVINLSAPIMQFFNALYLLINVGGAILMAVAMGKQKYEDVNRIFSLSMALNITIGLLVVIVGIFFLDNVVHLLCSDIALQPSVKEYVRIILWSSPVYIILPGLCVYVRTDSNPKLASIALITANVVNLGLNILFITVFSWGIPSASIATAIGFTVGIGIASLHFIKKERMIHFGKPAFSQKTGILLLTGLPLALASVLMTVRLLSVNHIILNSLGISGISILAVCFNLLMISAMFISGTVQTMQPIASVFYGAEDFKGVRLAIRAALKTLAICLFSLLILLLILPGFFASLFGLSDSTLMTQAQLAIRWFAFCIPLYGLNYLIMAVFQLSGRSNFSIIVSCTQALMVIPIMLAAMFLKNEPLIWISFAIGEALVFGIIWILSRIARRKKPFLLPITLIDATPNEETVLDFSIQGDIIQIKEFTDSVHQFLSQKNINNRCKNAIEVCAEELILNIMQHAFRNNKTHYIDIRLRLQSDKALLCITDDGIPFDPIKYNASGIGLLLVRKLCSNILYAYSLNQNVVVTEFQYHQNTNYSS